MRTNFDFTFDGFSVPQEDENLNLDPSDSNNIPTMADTSTKVNTEIFIMKDKADFSSRKQQSKQLEAGNSGFTMCEETPLTATLS